MINSALERRVLKDDDVALGVSVLVETAKVGVTALALLNGSPEAAIGLATVAGLGGALFKKQEERLAEFLRRWKQRSERLAPEDRRRMEGQLESEAGERIFEEAWRVAAGCVDPEKLDYLAELLTNGLASDKLAEHQTRRLLGLLEALDAVDFVILQSHLEENSAPEPAWEPSEEDQIQQSKFEAFRARHAALFRDETLPQRPFHPVGGEWTTPELPPEEEAKWQESLRDYQHACERHALFQNRQHRLIEMGVLGLENNALQNVKAGLTPLGSALLKIVGAAPDDEWGYAQATGALDMAKQMEDQRESHHRSQQQRDEKQKKREQRAAQQLEREARDFVYNLERRFR